MDNKQLQEEVLSSVHQVVRTVDGYKADIQGVKNDIEELRQKALNSKSEGEIEEVKAQLIELKSRGGRMGLSGTQENRTLVNDLAKSFRLRHKEIMSVNKRAPEVKYDLEPFPLEYKSQGANMTTASDLTGSSVTTYMLTPAVRGRRKVEIRDLVSIIPSATGTFSFYQQNASVSVGSVGFQGGQGLTKQQLEYLLTQVTVTTDYLSGFVRFPKQMAQDLPFLQSFLANELVEDYKRQESGSFLPTLAGAATGSTNVNGATVYAEKIINWIANLLAGDYSPSAVLVTASEWATLLLTKPDNYSLPGAVFINDQGDVTICGVPILVQNNMPASKTITGDWSKAAIIQTEGLSVQFFEQDSDNVQRNLITARVEARVGFATLRPDAFIYA